jgi:hypothetical protein
MEKTGKATQSNTRPDSAGLDARPGKSGEGARSAMEQLIQQERTRRDAQLPPEVGGTGDVAGSAT